MLRRHRRRRQPQRKPHRKQRLRRRPQRKKRNRKLRPRRKTLRQRRSTRRVKIASKDRSARQTERQDLRVTDREITAGIAVMDSRAVKAEEHRAAEAARAKAVRAEAPVRAAVVTSARHFPRWKRNRRRRMSKNAFIRIKKETNSPSWITAAARARRIKRESNSVPWRSRQNRRSTTDRSRS